MAIYFLPATVMHQNPLWLCSAVHTPDNRLELHDIALVRLVDEEKETVLKKLVLISCILSARVCKICFQEMV